MMKFADQNSSNEMSCGKSGNAILKYNFLNDVNHSNSDEALSLAPVPPPLPQVVTVVPIDKDAPSSENWYHGRLDRLASEERLRHANKPAGFLLRESERKPGSFVLSYLSYKSVVFHFKITAVFGDYYIGGRQFDRLETLISYYMYYSELVKGEKLLNPIPPPIVYKLERTCLSTRPYPSPKFPQDQLSNNISPDNEWSNSEDILYFNNIGERFRVFHEIEDGEWLWAQALSTNECGLLLAECVVYVDDDKLHEIEPWYYSNITKEDVRIILASVGDCSYLVRPSEQAPGNYTLFFNADVVHRYRITEIFDEYTNEFNNKILLKYFQIGGRNFSNISSIIDRYMNEDIVDGYRLTKIPHKRSEHYFNSIGAYLRTHLSKNQDDSDLTYYRRSDSKKNLNNQKKPIMQTQNMFSNDIESNLRQFPISVDYGHIETDFTVSKRNDSFNDGMKKTDLTQTSHEINSDKPKLHTKHQSQSSINSNSSSKMVTSKSVSAPISGYSTKEINNETKKKLGQSTFQSTDINILNRKNETINLRGYLNKYNEKTKKWKPYWFSLNQLDQQLFYFSNEKKVKEKGLIDCTYGFYYPLDDSFFNKPYCFQIIIHLFGSSLPGNLTGNSSNNNSSITHYLSADNFQAFTKWTENIRPICNSIQYNPFVSQKVLGNTSMSCLSLSPSLSSSTSSTCSSSSPAPTTTTSYHSSNSSSPMFQSLNDHKSLDPLKICGKISSDKNYRILSTLSIDIHEARNVCFHPLTQNNSKSSSPEVQTPLNDSFSSQQNYSSLPLMPKYHKENIYYCLILFNNEAFVASTRLTTCDNSQSPLNVSSNTESTQGSNKYTSKISIWDDSFSFDNLPLDVRDIKICLFCIAKSNTFSASFVYNLKKISNAISTSKMLDPILIGTVNIKLDDLINKGLQESWYSVEPAVQTSTMYNGSSGDQGIFSCSNEGNGKSVSNKCTMRVKIRFCEEKIQLNKDYYEELCSYLLDENEHKHLCTLYEQIIPSTERAHLVQALLRFFIVKNKIVEMLKSFLLAEIDRCPDLSTLFRPASMSTSLMDHYMRTRCSGFLHKALEEPLVRILRQNGSPSNTQNTPTTSTNVKSFELDPTKCLDQNQREQNLENFQTALIDMLNSICSTTSVQLFPDELKYLFHLVRQHVNSKLQLKSPDSCHTDEKLVRIYCVSAFVFLRLLCPAMLNPKSFGLKFFETSTANNRNNNEQSEAGEDCNNSLNYIDLAVKFSVFSPNFMFSLSSPANHNSFFQTFNQNSSSNHMPPLTVSSFNSSTNTSGSGSTNLGSSSSTTQMSLQSATTFERHIKLLAKVLQTLANMTECKEPFMMPLSEFLTKNKQTVTKFIDDISNLSELTEAQVIRISDFDQETNDLKSEKTKEDSFIDFESIQTQFEHATCKYLAILNRLLNTFVPQMKAYLENAESNINSEPFENKKEDDSSFLNSLRRLITILNGINDKSK